MKTIDRSDDENTFDAIYSVGFVCDFIFKWFLMQFAEDLIEWVVWYSHTLGTHIIFSYITENGIKRKKKTSIFFRPGKFSIEFVFIFSLRLINCSPICGSFLLALVFVPCRLYSRTILSILYGLVSACMCVCEFF